MLRTRGSERQGARHGRPEPCARSAAESVPTATAGPALALPVWAASA